MEIINFIRSYPAWAQVLFVACIVVQLCLALLVPRDSQSAKEQPNKGSPPTSAPHQNISGQGNIQIAQAGAVHIAAGSQANQRHCADALGVFIVEAQKLRARIAETPLPTKEHNEWVARVEEYLLENLGPAFKVRFSDFSGMTFYGDASEKSQFSRSIEGRSRRLHEFISEVTR